MKNVFNVGAHLQSYLDKRNERQSKVDEFIQAVQDGDLEDLRKRLSGKGVKINGRAVYHGLRGESALAHAAYAGRIDIMALLIEKGARVNQQAKYSIGERMDSPLHFHPNHDTALHEAARGGHQEAVRFLLDHGAKTGIKDISGRTALDVAKEQQPPNAGIVALLEGKLPGRIRRKGAGPQA